jgi:hypothetical protein
MSQANLSLANAAGAIFRAALNSAIGALVTNNSGATEPSPTYPNMWWYDTANAQLKRRNNANDAWIIMGLEAASTDGTFAANSDSLVPTQKAAKTYADTKLASSALDTDGTLAANSDAKVATQKAGKTYADTKLSKTTAGEIAALTEKTTLADDDVFLIEDSADSNAKKKVKKSSIGSGNQSFLASGTWTAPAGVRVVFVTGTGGGGGGGGSQSSSSEGGGGGGGASCYNSPVKVTPGTVYNVTVGAKGTGGAYNGNGTAGGNSAFVGDVATITLGGGGGGQKGRTAGSGGVATVTAAAVPGTATFYTPGANGIFPNTAANGGAGGAGASGESGAGGSTYFGIGAAGRTTGFPISGISAAAYSGAGGSGSGGTTNAGQVGGNGGEGFIYLSW